MKKVKKVTKKRLKFLARKEDIKKEKEVRDFVKDIQNNKCYLCYKNVLGKSAHIHHIISRDIKPLKYDKLNLVLLCPRCHKLSNLSVHQSGIYFCDILLNKDRGRYDYLIDKLKELGMYK